MKRAIHFSAAHSLALAILKSSAAPALLLDGNLTMICGSASFDHAYGLEPCIVTGRATFRIGAGEWDVPQLRSLLAATFAVRALIEAYGMDLERHTAPQRLVLNTQKLDCGVAEQVHLLLTISDVTGARISEKVVDDPLREKAIPLQELQHRVASSLEILASVSMQSAWRVRSEGARADLQDGHSRVIPIASLQQQLTASRLGDVELSGHFTELCESLGASMIDDHDRILIAVTADGSSVNAEMSVSLGLIVTELMIIALKHAFPNDRTGHILTDYQSHKADRTLSVSAMVPGRLRRFAMPGRVLAPGLWRPWPNGLARLSAPRALIPRSWSRSLTLKQGDSGHMPLNCGHRSPRHAIGTSASQTGGSC